MVVGAERGHLADRVDELARWHPGDGNDVANPDVLGAEVAVEIGLDLPAAAARARRCRHGETNRTRSIGPGPTSQALMQS